MAEENKLRGRKVAHFETKQSYSISPIRSTGLQQKEFSIDTKNIPTKDIPTKRTKVDKALTPDYAPIGAVTSFWDDKGTILSNTGTGTLVGVQTVLTAASIIYNRKTQKSSEKVLFIAAQDGINGEQFEISNISLNKHYVDASLSDEDASRFNYALLTLSRSAEHYGRFGVAFQPSNNFTTENFWKDTLFKITGYSGLHFNINQQQPSLFEKFLYTEQGKIQNVSDHTLTYKFQTTKADVGAPIYYQDKDGEPYIVGIHNQSWTDIFSTGIAITKKAFKVVGAAVEALNSKEFSLEGEPPSGENVKLPLHKIQELTKVDYIERASQNSEELSIIEQYVYPNTSVGLLLSKWKDGRTVKGTAFIISKHAILTAYDNVYDKDDVVAIDIAFFAGYFDKKGVGFPIVKVVTVNSSASKNRNRYRLALLFVKENIQISFGSLSLLDEDSNSESFKKRDFTISGYPSHPSKTDFQFSDTGLLHIVGRGQIFHEIATGPGSGGSPIYFKSPQSQKYSVVAVHLGIQREKSFAAKITNSVLNFIKQEINKHSSIDEATVSSSFIQKTTEQFSFSSLLSLIPTAVEVVSSVASLFEIRFGDNTSEKVKQSSDFPYCLVGRININFGELKGHGTGTLISENIVLTCGHNLFYRQKNLQATYIGFCPGYSSSKQGQKFIKAKAFSLLPKYLNLKNSAYSRQDIGIIALSQKVDFKDYFKVESREENENFWSTKELNIVGYPADLSNGEELYIGRGKALRFQDGKIVHRIDTFGGNSGSAIYYTDEETKQPIIVGIHTGGRNETKLNQGYNFGPRISTAILQFINQFKESHKITQKDAEQKEFSFDPNLNIPLFENFGQFSFTRNDLNSNLHILPFVKISNEALREKQNLYEENFIKLLTTVKDQQVKQGLNKRQPLKVAVYVPIVQTATIKQEDWNEYFPRAIKLINEAAPGLRLKLVRNQKQLQSEQFVIRFDMNKQSYFATFNNLLVVKNPIVSFPEKTDTNRIKSKEMVIKILVHALLRTLGVQYQIKQQIDEPPVIILPQTSLFNSIYSDYSNLAAFIQSSSLTPSFEPKLLESEFLRSKSGEDNSISQIDRLYLSILYPNPSDK